MLQNKVLILGAGLVAAPMIKYLLSRKISVTVASNTPERSETMIGGHPNGRSVFWEASDEPGLGDLVKSHDLIVSLLPYIFHVMVAKHCIRHSKSMVTTSYVKPEMKALSPQADTAGIIILNEIGLDPGIDHMSAMRIIDHIHSKGGAVLEFYSLCGALPAPEASRNPFRYKFSWSPKGVVMAGNNDAVFLRDGQKVSIPTSDLFRNPLKVDFPELGLLEVYPNRDSVAYQEIYGIPEARTVFRGTFRYQGWCEILDAIKRLNLISYDKINMDGMTLAGLVRHHLQSIDNSSQTFQMVSGEKLRRKTAGILGIPDDSVAMTALEWMGLFGETPMNRKTDSPFDVVSDLMISRMGLGSDERDMIVMQHTFLAGYSDGKREVIRSRMKDFGSPGGDTSVARTVALPAAIAVEMILKEEIKLKGVHIPVLPQIYIPVLEQLEQMGIRMTEEFSLPESENIF